MKSNSAAKEKLFIFLLLSHLGSNNITAESPVIIHLERTGNRRQVGEATKRLVIVNAKKKYCAPQTIARLIWRHDSRQLFSKYL